MFVVVNNSRKNLYGKLILVKWFGSCNWKGVWCLKGSLVLVFGNIIVVWFCGRKCFVILEGFLMFLGLLYYIYCFMVMYIYIYRFFVLVVLY